MEQGMSEPADEPTAGQLADEAQRLGVTYWNGYRIEYLGSHQLNPEQATSRYDKPLTPKWKADQ
jgi:hypothetical protein